MAFTQLTSDLNIIAALSQLPNQTDGLGSAQLQAKFDEAANTIKVYLNSTLIGELQSTAAAGNMGIVTITGVTATNIQEALEDLKNQIDGVAVGAIPDESLAPSKADDDLFFSDHNYYTSTNSGNNYSITSGRSLSSLTAGMTFKVKINADASGNTTLNVDGLGAVNILKANGSNVTNLKNGGIYTLVYGGTSFTLQGEGGEGTAVISEVLETKTFTNDTGDTLTGTMPNNAGDNVALASSVASTTLKLRAPEGYYDGTDDNVTITDADFVATNIKTGVNLFGTTGTLASIKSIQTGTITDPFNNTTSTTYNHTITSVDTNTSVVLIKYNTPSIRADSGTLYGSITSSTNLRLTRGTALTASTADVDYTVIEFDNVASLQTGTENINATTTDNVTISSVDTSKSWVIVASIGQSVSTGDNTYQIVPFAELTTSTNLALNNTTGILISAGWQVIEFN